MSKSSNEIARFTNNKVVDRLMQMLFTEDERRISMNYYLWFVDTMVNVCGQRQAEICCEKGLMLTTEQAHKIGMVDEIVPPDQVEARAQEEIKSWLKIPDFARQLTKMQLRKPTIDKLLAKREEDITNFRDFIMKESVQKTLGFYLESLKKKK